MLYFRSSSHCRNLNLHSKMSLLKNTIQSSHSLKSLLFGRALASNIRYYSDTSLQKLDADIPTHTGQVWDESDSRLARFTNTPKQVNPQWSINLIKEIPPVPVKGRVAICEGGPSEALGHPKIYINLDNPEPKSCIYCGLRYFNEDTHH